MHQWKPRLRLSAMFGLAVLTTVLIGCVAIEPGNSIRAHADLMDRPIYFNDYNDNDNGIIQPPQLGAGDRLGNAVYEHYRYAASNGCDTSKRIVRSYSSSPLTDDALDDTAHASGR